MSLDLLGAEDARALLVRVSPKQILASQKGLAGAGAGFAAAIVPGTVSDLVLKTMRDQLVQKLKDAGVEAEVTLVNDLSQISPSPPQGDLLGGVFLGSLLTALGYGIWKGVRILFF